MSGYVQGRKVEYDVIEALKADGYDTVRAASSKGMADVVAVKTGEVLFVSCKRTEMPRPTERADLLRLAALLPDVAMPLREWDAERDARTGCDECGLTLARCDCTEPDPMPDPDDLTPADAACWDRMCTAVARAVRHELPYASAARVAEELDQRAGAYRDRAKEETHE